MTTMTTPTPPKLPHHQAVLLLTKNQCDLALAFSSHTLRGDLRTRFAAPETLVNLEDSYGLVQDGLNTIYRHIRRGGVSIEELEAAAVQAAREALALLTAIRGQQVPTEQGAGQ